jgi:hypothetical protein
MSLELIEGTLARARGGRYIESYIYDERKNSEALKEFDRSF